VLSNHLNHALQVAGLFPNLEAVRLIASTTLRLACASLVNEPISASASAV
jgi:hypothetical protein